MRKKIILLVAILILILIISSCAVILKPSQGESDAVCATICVDGEVYATYSLNTLTEPISISIDTAFGHNTAIISNKGVQITDSDCKNGLCIKQGLHGANSVPIVCLPHKLVIIVEYTSVSKKTPDAFTY